MLIFLNILFGAGLLIAGRQLFWYLVGIIGFVVGVAVASQYFHSSELITIVAGLILGMIFAGMAVIIESTAILLVGFLGGGYIILSISKLLGFGTSTLNILGFVVGGILGLVLIAFMFDWALITISSLIGASLIVESFNLHLSFASLAFLGLLIAGVIIQSAALHRKTSSQ